MAGKLHRGVAWARYLPIWAETEREGAAHTPSPTPTIRPQPKQQIAACLSLNYTVHTSAPPACEQKPGDVFRLAFAKRNDSFLVTSCDSKASSNSDLTAQTNKRRFASHLTGRDDPVQQACPGRILEGATAAPAFVAKKTTHLCVCVCLVTKEPRAHL